MKKRVTVPVYKDDDISKLLEVVVIKTKEGIGYLNVRYKPYSGWLTKYGSTKKRVPLQVKIKKNEPVTIPEELARLAYEQYSYLFGNDQSFERIHERGGFGYIEVICLLADLLERERGKLNAKTN